MTDDTHTPGPWKMVRKPLLDGHETASWDVYADIPEGAGWVAFSPVGPHAFNEANAALIAAAPDLLEACETALQNLAPAYASEHLVIQRLRAAIMQAKGAGA